jgi:hypothetical protein
VGSGIADPPRGDRAGCLARPGRTGGSGVTTRPAGQPRSGARVTRLITSLPGARDPLVRWSTRRQVFAALLAEHEAGGHTLSPASWQRLKDDAARRTAAVLLPAASRRPDAVTAPVLPPQDGGVVAPVALAATLAGALPNR